MNFDYFVLIFFIATAISDVLFIKPKNMKYCYKSVSTQDSSDSSDDEPKDDGYHRAPDAEVPYYEQPPGYENFPEYAHPPSAEGAHPGMNPSYMQQQPMMGQPVMMQPGMMAQNGQPFMQQQQQPGMMGDYV